MSIPPPNHPPGFAPSSSSHRVSAESQTARQQKSTKNKNNVASIIPVLVAAITVVLGAIPAALTEATDLAIVGYFLSGFVPIMCLAWDSVSQRKGLSDPNFILKPTYSTFLRWIVAFGFLVAIWNLYHIALPIAEFLSNPIGGN